MVTLPTGRGLLAVALFAVLFLAYHLLERERGTPDVGPSPAPGAPESEELEELDEPDTGETDGEEPEESKPTRQDDAGATISPREGIAAHPSHRHATGAPGAAGEAESGGAAEPELAEAGR